MEYDVYRVNTPGASEENHERMKIFYEKVVDEDFELCEGVQRNLERGVYDRGVMHPFHEEGVKAFQGMVLGCLREHIELEKRVGMEVWAARPKEHLDFTEEEREQDVQEILNFCGGRDSCVDGRDKELEW